MVATGAPAPQGPRMDLGLVVGFEWDDGNRTKCQKHGVSIGQIETMFARPSRTGPAAPRRGSETRYYAIGTTDTGRPLFVVFTLRGTSDGRLIRAISARYMHRKELDRYA